MDIKILNTALYMVNEIMKQFRLQLGKRSFPFKVFASLLGESE